MTTYFDYETLRDTVTAQAIKIHQIEQERDTARANARYWEERCMKSFDTDKPFDADVVNEFLKEEQK